MDAEATLALVRARNRFVRQLPSGLWARIALPRIRDALAAGDIPLPVLREMAKIAANGEAQPEDADVSPDSLQHVARYQSGLVLRALKAIGEHQVDVLEDAEITPEIVAELDQDDFDQIFRWADRQDPVDPTASPSELLPVSPSQQPAES